MSPEYLSELADKVDHEELWRLPGMDQMSLPPDKRWRLDAGVALRRHAEHVRRLQALLEMEQSLLITPLSPNGSVAKAVDTPPEHQKLRRRSV